MNIKQRSELLKQKINSAAEKTNRSANDIAIICVTKYARINDVVEVIRLGYWQIGENQLQKASQKQHLLKQMLEPNEYDRIKWHMVGHLQTNKVANAIEIFSLIHSVDSIRLAQCISEKAQKSNCKTDILVQVNISEECQKSGVSWNDSLTLIDRIVNLSGLRLKGLMGIGPYTSDSFQIRTCFRKLKQLFDKMNNQLLEPMSILSMGMSDDFEIAIEEGSTMIRVGRVLFGEYPREENDE